jgi:hypothetical protein
MRLNLGCGNHQLDGYVNLDKNLNPHWYWETGLGIFPTASIECISSSHTLMYVEPSHWGKICHEAYRILKIGSIWRITEDECDNPLSNKFGGHTSKGGFTVYQTSPDRFRPYLLAAGFKVYEVQSEETRFRDNTICQNYYPPEVANSFFLEAIKCL